MEIFEKTNNNVVVNYADCGNSYIFDITHKNKTFSLIVSKDLFKIEIYGQSVKIDVHGYPHIAFISIIHNNKLIGYVKISAPEYGFMTFSNVEWHDVNGKIYKTALELVI